MLHFSKNTSCALQVYKWCCNRLMQSWNRCPELYAMYHTMMEPRYTVKITRPCSTTTKGSLGMTHFWQNLTTVEPHPSKHDCEFRQEPVRSNFLNGSAVIRLTWSWNNVQQASSTNVWRHIQLVSKCFCGTTMLSKVTFELFCRGMHTLTVRV